MKWTSLEISLDSFKWKIKKNILTIESYYKDIPIQYYIRQDYPIVVYSYNNKIKNINKGEIVIQFKHKEEKKEL